MSLRKPSFEDEASSREINISPLIDVMFILLIFFVVTMAFSEKSVLGIERPKSDEAQIVKEKSLGIFVDKYGKIFTEENEVDIETLKNILRKKTERAVVIDADGSVDLTKIVEIMDACKASGIEQIFIAADVGKAVK